MPQLWLANLNQLISSCLHCSVAVCAWSPRGPVHSMCASSCCEELWLKITASSFLDQNPSQKLSGGRPEASAPGKLAVLVSFPRKLYLMPILVCGHGAVLPVAHISLPSTRAVRWLGRKKPKEVVLQQGGFCKVAQHSTMLLTMKLSVRLVQENCWPFVPVVWSLFQECQVTTKTSSCCLKWDPWCTIYTPWNAADGGTPVNHIMFRQASASLEHSLLKPSRSVVNWYCQKSVSSHAPWAVIVGTLCWTWNRKMMRPFDTSHHELLNWFKISSATTLCQFFHQLLHGLFCANSSTSCYMAVAQSRIHAWFKVLSLKSLFLSQFTADWSKRFQSDDFHLGWQSCRQFEPT